MQDFVHREDQDLDELFGEEIAAEVAELQAAKEEEDESEEETAGAGAPTPTDETADPDLIPDEDSFQRLRPRVVPVAAGQV